MNNDSMVNAISDGVVRSMNFLLAKISKDELLDAVRGGIEDAVWAAIRNATDCPTADFFQSIKDGVEAAHLKMKKK